MSTGQKSRPHPDAVLMPADAEVTTEGCDCYGEVGGVVVLPDDGEVGEHWVGTVLIFRPDGDWSRGHAL